eukprot:Skav225300  [mRNA]  locus=scaffold445:107646:108962:- [translate_table: standard]
MGELSRCLGREFLGTFLLLCSVIFSRLCGPPLWSGLAVASAQVVLLQAQGSHGGMFNPAITFALGAVKSFGGHGLPWRQVWALMLAQLLGALAAAVMSTLCIGKELPVGDYVFTGMLALATAECLYTCMICFVALNVTSPKRKETEFFAVAVGCAVLAGVYGAGNIASGGTFNPAVAVALDVTSPTFGLNGNGLLFSALQLPSAYMAAWLYSKVRPSEFGKPESEGTYREQSASECIGSTMVVLTACLNFRTGTIIGPLSVAASMTSMAFAVQDVSGGHFNPAITLAQAIAGWSGRWYAHCLAQICGAFVACCFTSIMLVHHGSFGPKLPYNLTQALLSEGIFTFLLCLVFLSVNVSSITKASQFSGLALGFCIIAGGFAICSISGASFNPVIGLALALAGGGLRNALAYAAAQLSAACLAAAAYQVMHGSEGKKEDP